MGCILLTLASLLLPFEAICQVHHTVEIKGHEFVPRDLELTVGDTVTWVWKDPFHDVNSGSGGEADGVFQSGILALGDTYTVTFDRPFLRSVAASYAPNDSGTISINYFCAPHFLMGMTGTLTIDSIPAAFEADLSSRQNLTGSAETGAVSLEVAANEKTARVTGAHSIGGETEVLLVSAPFGSTTGSTVTAFSTAPSLDETITFSPGLADLLHAGELRIVVRSSSFPAGEIEGQLVRSEVRRHLLHGKIATVGNVGVSGVRVEVGTSSAITDAFGNFSIGDLRNGVHRIVLSSSVYGLTPSTLFVLVNGKDSYAPDVSASPLDPVVSCGAIESGGLSLRAESPSNSVDVPFTYTSVSGSNVKSVSYTLDGNTNLVSPLRATSGSFVASVPNGAHMIRVYAFAERNGVACTYTSTRDLVVRSPLNPQNAIASLKLGKKLARVRDANQMRKMRSSLLLQLRRMRKGGTTYPGTPQLSSANVSSAIKELEKLDRGGARARPVRMKRLINYLKALQP